MLTKAYKFPGGPKRRPVELRVWTGKSSTTDPRMR